MDNRRPVVVIGSTIIVFVGALLLWIFSGSQSQSANFSWITDQAVLTSQIEISGIGIATGASFVGHRIRVIHATIKNNSGQNLKAVEVKMVFNDIQGKPVQESVETILQLTQKPLPPGSRYRFEVNFENLPKSWNYHIPDIEILKAAY